MAKDREKSPLAPDAHFDKIVGGDPGQVREKVRRSSTGREASLLTSRDLFGDIIEDIRESDPRAEKRPPARAPEGGRRGSGLPETGPVARVEPGGPPGPRPVRADTDPAGPSAPGVKGPDEYSLVELAYSTLLQDDRLNRAIADVDASEPQSASRGGHEYGQYLLVDLIATGGMAEVFRAKRKGVEGFEKIVAVKRILPHLSPNKAFVEMFINEAKMVAGLSHPNIVQIFELGKIGDTYFIAMEYVDGKDLRTILGRLREKGAVPDVDLAALIASRVGSALEYAHRQLAPDGRPLRIVHRDVSPQNILISNEGEVKLVDFGIAKAAVKASHTDSGSLRGKLLYMSPEQAWGRAIDNRSDIFSLGVVLFEMLTGRTLFSGDSEMSILERVREAKIIPPSAVNPAVPIELEAVVTRALRRNPEEQYQDASEMLSHLDSYLRRRPAVGSPDLARFVKTHFRVEEAPPR